MIRKGEGEVSKVVGLMVAYLNMFELDEEVFPHYNLILFDDINILI